MTDSSRRAYLRRALAVGAAVTAGCLGDSGPETDRSPPPSTNGDGAGTSVPATTPSPTSPDAGTTAGDRNTGTGDASTKTDTPTETPRPMVAWRGSLDAAVSTRPVVADGAVYAGTRDGTVTRRALADGSARWTVGTDDPVRDLAVTGGAVLAVSGTTDLAAGHTLHALDAASGESMWTFQPGGWWLDLLAARDGTAYVATADDVLESAGERLFAVPVAAGDPAWEAEIGDPREAVLTADAVYVSSTDRLDAFERGDGTRRWRVTVPDPTLGTLSVADGTVAHGFQPEDALVYGVLAGFDAESGAERWRIDDWTVTSATARGGDLYAGGARVVSVDPAEGTTRWQSEKSGFVTDASVTGDRVYAGGDVGRALSRGQGRVEWTWTPDPSQGGAFPAGVVDGAVVWDSYHDADPRNQYKFATAPDGSQRWAFEAGTELADLGIGADVAVTGGEDGALYALS